MNKMVFKYVYNYDNQPRTDITYETDAVTLPEILEEFTRFLNGCGFQVDGLEEIDDEQ